MSPWALPGPMDILFLIGGVTLVFVSLGALPDPMSTLFLIGPEVPKGSPEGQ